MRKFFTALLMTLVFTVPAFAKTPDKEMREHKNCECCEHKMGMPGMHKRGDMLGMLIKHADKVGLSGEQVVKLKAVHRSMQKKSIQLDADMKLARIDLKEIMEVKDFDLEKANAAVQKISDIKKDQHLEMLKSMKDVRSILTDEQFKKIKEMKHRMWEGKKPSGKKPEMKKQKEHQE
jgi:Spy/CpxP family protein refolding chaperone